MRADMCIDMCTTCVIDMCADMCIDMCTEMYIDMHADMCIDMGKDRHVQRHVHSRTYMHVHSSQAQIHAEACAVMRSRCIPRAVSFRT